MGLISTKIDKMERETINRIAFEILSTGVTACVLIFRVCIVDAWEQRKIGNEVNFFSGLTYSPDNVVENEGTFVLRSSNVKNGEIVNADDVYVQPDVVNSDNVQLGDIIVVVRNGSRDLIGKHAQIKQKMNDTVIGAFMTGIRSETPNFTNAMLDTQQFNMEINKNLGATINQITTGSFKNMKFIVPTSKEEKEKVGDFFNQLDNLITLHQRKPFLR